MIVDALRACHRQPDLLAHGGGLDVEVVQHLDVIADEPERTEHDSPEIASVLAQVVVHIRTKPGIFGTAAAAMIHSCRRKRQTGSGAEMFSEPGHARVEL